MQKHTVVYVDEEQNKIHQFQREVSATLEVIGMLPQANLDEFVQDLLKSAADAFVIDFRLNEYRDDVNEPINYDGADVAQKILSVRKGFPCFILTSFDQDAVQKVDNVHYVYPREMLRSPVGEVSLAEKIRIQIEHYHSILSAKQERFYELLEKSERTNLSEDEENELLRLDNYLESALCDYAALSEEKKTQLAIGKIEELLASTKDLLSRLKGGNV